MEVDALEKFNRSTDFYLRHDRARPKQFAALLHGVSTATASSSFMNE